MHTTEDALREYFNPGGVPLSHNADLTIKDLAAAVEAHFTQEIREAEQRGARRTKDAIVAELDRLRGEYNTKKDDALKDGKNRAWWVNTARVLLTARLRLFIRRMED